MTVKELKELLKDEPDDREVYLSQDEEGNGFKPFSGFSHSIFDEDNEMMYDPSWEFDQVDCDFETEEEWEEYKKTAKISLVIWP